MATPAINIPVEKRVPLEVNIPEMGANYTGATLAAEIRTSPGGSGDPVIALATATPPTQGLSVTYDAAFVDPLGELPNGASVVKMLVAETTLEALAYAADPAVPVVLHYDIHLTPDGGTKFVFARGTFTVNPGVTL